MWNDPRWLPGVPACLKLLIFCVMSPGLYFSFREYGEERPKTVVVVASASWAAFFLLWVALLAGGIV